jgi:hypothetical protein
MSSNWAELSSVVSAAGEGVGVSRYGCSPAPPVNPTGKPQRPIGGSKPAASRSGDFKGGVCPKRIQTERAEAAEQTEQRLAQRV